MADAFKFSLKVDQRQFDAALKRYAATTQKLPSEIVNQKGWRIGQKAVWYAPVTTAEQIKTELGMEKAMELVKLKSGRFSHAKKNLKAFFSNSPDAQDAPLLALIIQARASHGGKPSPWKGKSREEGARAMLDEMRRVYGARQKSRAYFKACFATIRDIFKNAVKRLPFSAPDSRGSGTFGSLGRDKGRIADARPATGAGRALATLTIISPRHDLKGAIYKHAEPALQRAFDEEGASTWQHAIENEYRQAARLLGIKTN